MIAETMEKMGSSYFLCIAAFGVSSVFGNALSEQCVLSWYSHWFLSCQYKQCGCYVKLLLCYDSFSPFGSGVDLLYLSANFFHGFYV
jgi:hypothetical protein